MGSDVSAFPQLKLLLEQVYRGRPVSEPLWAGAAEELRQAEGAGVTPAASPTGVVSDDAAVMLAGRLFLALEATLASVNRAGYDIAVSSDVIDVLIDAKQLLVARGCEPVATRRDAPIMIGVPRHGRRRMT